MKPENQPSYTSPESTLVDALPTVKMANEIIADKTLDKGAEQYERTSELSSIVSDMAVSQLPPIVVPTNANDNSTSINDPSVNTSVAPVTAGDDDLIEKEWVDRAKKIVVETHDDPYKREQEVSKLQSDYIKKRYGRELGVPE